MNLVEARVNDVFETKDYGDGLHEWAFIAMILGDLGPDWYKEIKRYDRRDKFAQFRLIIDHAQFKSATKGGKVKLLCDAMLRSLLALEEMHIEDLDVQAIRFDFLTVARLNGWSSDP